MITIGSLFSGYGGIELGLETTGHFKTIWQSEIEPYPSAILKERFPKTPNHGDIKKINWEEIERPDILCGGFPCQDISNAGKRKGIKKGTRSGLWFEFHKAIRILRPRYVLIENVSAITTLGLDIVLGSLAEIRYDAEWVDIRASDFGAPHKRERIFIVAYQSRNIPNTNSDGHYTRGFEQHNIHKDCREELVSQKSKDWQERNRECESQYDGKSKNKISNTNDGNVERSKNTRRIKKSRKNPEQQLRRHHKSHSGWKIEPDMGRVVNGSARGMDSYIWRERIKALGNGVVPQVAQWVGEQIIKEAKETMRKTIKEKQR